MSMDARCTYTQRPLVLLLGLTLRFRGFQALETLKKTRVKSASISMYVLHRSVGVEILNHCIKPPETGRDSQHVLNFTNDTGGYARWGRRVGACPRAEDRWPGGDPSALRPRGRSGLQLLILVRGRSPCRGRGFRQDHLLEQAGQGGPGAHLGALVI